MLRYLAYTPVIVTISAVLALAVNWQTGTAYFVGAMVGREVFGLIWSWWERRSVNKSCVFIDDPVEVARLMRGEDF